MEVVVLMMVVVVGGGDVLPLDLAGRCWWVGVAGASERVVRAAE